MCNRYDKIKDLSMEECEEIYNLALCRERDKLEKSLSDKNIWMGVSCKHRVEVGFPGCKSVSVGVVSDPETGVPCIVAEVKCDFSREDFNMYRRELHRFLRSSGHGDFVSKLAILRGY